MNPSKAPSDAEFVANARELATHYDGNDGDPDKAYLLRQLATRLEAATRGPSCGDTLAEIQRTIESLSNMAAAHYSPSYDASKLFGAKLALQDLAKWLKQKQEGM